MSTRARGAAAVSFAIAMSAGCTSGGLAADDAPPPRDGALTDAHDDIDAPRAIDAREPDARVSELDVFQSGTRLKMRVGTTADGAKTFLGWRDTMRNEDCAFATAADGAIRCLPATAATYSADLFWGDSACATIRLATTAAGCPMVGGYVRAVTTCAPFRFTMYALGAHHTGAVYVKSGATCTLYTGASEYYVVGAEIAPTDFVEAIESLE